MCTVKPLQMLSNFGQNTPSLWSLPAGSCANNMMHRNMFYYCNGSNSIKMLRYFSKLLPNARKASNTFLNSELAPSPQVALLVKKLYDISKTNHSWYIFHKATMYSSIHT